MAQYRESRGTLNKCSDIPTLLHGIPCLTYRRVFVLSVRRTGSIGFGEGNSAASVTILGLVFLSDPRASKSGSGYRDQRANPITDVKEAIHNEAIRNQIPSRIGDCRSTKPKGIGKGD